MNNGNEEVAWFYELTAHDMSKTSSNKYPL